MAECEWLGGFSIRFCSNTRKSCSASANGHQAKPRFWVRVPRSDPRVCFTALIADGVGSVLCAGILASEACSSTADLKGV
jgi:hypothetical protein